MCKMPEGLPCQFYKRGAERDGHQDRRLRMVRRLIRGCSGKCLDYGCGYGDITFEVSGAFSKIIGVDTRHERVEWAGKEFSPIEFQVCAADRLSFADHSFDTVISIVVLNWVSDPMQYLRETCRVLTSGGTLVIAAAAPDQVSALARKLTGKAPQQLDYQAITLRTMKAMLKEAGYQATQADCFYDPISVKGYKSAIAECLRLPLRILRLGGFAPYYGLRCVKIPEPM